MMVLGMDAYRSWEACLGLAMRYPVFRAEQSLLVELRSAYGASPEKAAFVQ